MSITLDANVLLYASDAESPQQERALEVLAERASGEELLYLFWPALSAYLRLATHPSVFRRPLSLDLAIANLEDLLARPQAKRPARMTGSGLSCERCSPRAAPGATWSRTPIS